MQPKPRTGPDSRNRSAGHVADEAGRIAELVEEVVEEGMRERARKGKTVLGVKKILPMDPLSTPETVEKSPKPRFHAYRKSVRKQMWEAYSWVLAAFRDAAERLRAGDRSAAFPEGTFPPGLPFVPVSRRGRDSTQTSRPVLQTPAEGRVDPREAAQLLLPGLGLFVPGAPSRLVRLGKRDAEKCPAPLQVDGPPAVGEKPVVRVGPLPQRLRVLVEAVAQDPASLPGKPRRRGAFQALRGVGRPDSVLWDGSEGAGGMGLTAGRGWGTLGSVSDPAPRRCAMKQQIRSRAGGAKIKAGR